jgi:hypothetical protein
MIFLDSNLTTDSGFVPDRNSFLRCRMGVLLDPTARGDARCGGGCFSGLRLRS